MHRSFNAKRRRFFGNGTQNVNYVPYTNNLVLWLDASDKSTITESSNSVSQWDDRSGKNNHATQGTGSAQPITNTNTINNLNCLNFDNAQYLHINLPTNLTGTNFTFFLVYERTNIVNDAYVLSLVTNGVVNDYDNTTSLLVAGADISTGLDLRDYANPSALSLSSYPPNNTPFVYTSVYDGVNNIHYVDSVAGTTVAATNNFSFKDIYINARYTSSAVSAPFNKINLAEVLIYQDTLDINVINIVNQYLSNKWGVPLS